MSTWRKAKASASTNCVEVRRVILGVDVRNSRDPDGPQLCFTSAEWDAFLDGVRKGEFDREALG